MLTVNVTKPTTPEAFVGADKCPGAPVNTHYLLDVLVVKVGHDVILMRSMRMPLLARKCYYYYICSSSSSCMKQ